MCNKHSTPYFYIKHIGSRLPILLEKIFYIVYNILNENFARRYEDYRYNKRKESFVII